MTLKTFSNISQRDLCIHVFDRILNRNNNGHQYFLLLQESNLPSKNSSLLRLRAF